MEEHGKDWRNSGRAVRRKVELWQNMEKIGGTVVMQGKDRGRWNSGREWKRLEEQWQSNEKEGGTVARRTEYWRTVRSRAFLATFVPEGSSCAGGYVRG